MIASILRRLAFGLLTVFAVATFTFVLIHAAPGEPFAPAMADARLTPEIREAFRSRYELDRPMRVQFASYVGKIARGDLGESFSHSRPVADVLSEALPRTLLLVGTALLAGFAVGILLALKQAMRPGGLIDRFGQWFSVVIGSIPDFWIALGLLLLFAVRLGWFPIGGMRDLVMHDYMSPAGKAADIARHLALPALSLALLVMAVVARHQRAAIADAMPEDYIRTARAKGLADAEVLRRHALRNALLPVVTLAGLMLPALAGGAVFVEAIYAWPGLGGLTVHAVGARDYPLVIGATLLVSTLVVVGTIVFDVASALIDPRQRRA
ncbi:MAG: ABC transporter permease [Gemmatimonadota bacterium]